MNSGTAQLISACGVGSSLAGAVLCRNLPTYKGLFEKAYMTDKQ